MNEDIALKICKECNSTCCKLGGTDFTKVEMLEVLKAGYPDYFVKLNDNHYEMKSKNGICLYLKNDNSCLIHKIRPLACKSFPVYLNCNNNKTDFFLIECPLAVSLSEKDIKVMKNQAGSVAQIINTTFSNSKLSKYDLQIIEKRFNKFKRKELIEKYLD